MVSRVLRRDWRREGRLIPRRAPALRRRDPAAGTRLLRQGARSTAGRKRAILTGVDAVTSCSWSKECCAGRLLGCRPKTMLCGGSGESRWVRGGRNQPYLQSSLKWSKVHRYVLSQWALPWVVTKYSPSESGGLA